MPLLKGRFMLPNKPLKNVGPNERIYTISHTQEQFRSKEYPFWSCHITIQYGVFLSQSVYYC